MLCFPELGRRNEHGKAFPLITSHGAHRGICGRIQCPILPDWGRRGGEGSMCEPPGEEDFFLQPYVITKSLRKGILATLIN